MREVLRSHLGDDAEGPGPVVPPELLHLLAVPSLPRRHSGGSSWMDPQYELVKKNLSNFSSSSRTTTRPFAGRATPGRCLAVFRPSHEMNFVCDCETNQTLYTPTAPEEMRPHFTFRRERQREGDSRSLTTERGRKKLPFPTLCFLEVGRFCSGLILEQLS